MSDQARRDANAEISKKLDQARQLLKECQALADQHALSFSFNPAYGMGGTYYGKGNEEWSSSSDGSEGEWVSSSSQC